MREPAEQPTLHRAVERAVEVVGPCDWASISLRRRRNRLETVASTSELAERCDQAQYALAQGPCVEAALSEDYFLSEDLAHEQRWPSWSPRAAAAGVRSVMSIRLTTETEVLGSLNLYSGSTTWLPDEVDVALIYAAHAANAMSSAKRATGLQVAVERRHSIGVAQGMLMMRYDLTLDQSFEVLRRLSSQHNIKLRDLAAQVVAQRGLPDHLLGAAGD
ncbi:MAG: GAF and ANTAR domain-containing protein [Marmoricola sp.]|nr:GAF and ANTAR domain-containing protein [Marmoricola sp.]